MGKVKSSFYIFHSRTVKCAHDDVDRFASDGSMNAIHDWRRKKTACRGSHVCQASIFPFTASFPFDQAFCVSINIRDALFANGEGAARLTRRLTAETSCIFMLDLSSFATAADNIAAFTPVDGRLTFLSLKALSLPFGHDCVSSVRRSGLTPLSRH